MISVTYKRIIENYFFSIDYCFIISQSLIMSSAQQKQQQQQQQQQIDNDELAELLGLTQLDPTEDTFLNDSDVMVQEQQLYELIRDRACESQIEIGALEQVICSLIQPAAGATIPAILTLAQNSLQTSDVVLSKALQSTIIEDIPSAATTSQDNTVYYIRSISMVVEEALRLTDKYRDTFYDDAYCDVLLEMLAAVPDNQIVYFRYVGCTSASTPQERHLDDIQSNIPTRFGNFYSILSSYRGAELCIHQIDPLTVKGELGKASDSQRVLIDSTEQALIHLLDRKVLLNSQPGGYFRSYVPDEQTRSCINELNLTTVKAYFSGISMGNQVQNDAIEDHFNELREDIEGMGTADSDRYKNMLEPTFIKFLAQQASGGLSIGGGMPFMIFAKDITYSDFRNVTRFFDESRAGDITKLLASDILGGSVGFSMSCFQNLWCIPCKRTKELLPHFISCAAKIVRTLNAQLIVTLGYDPAVVSFSQFRDW